MCAALGVETMIDDSGEILTRSNVVMEGYWNQPDETRKVLVDGWFRTGDGGSIGDNHFLTIADRRKDVIISGGENVSSIEVELIAHTRTRLAAYKCPKRIEFRTELTRTATGKLKKFKLRAPYWEGRTRQVN